jgi:hypothetical protein
VTEPVPVRVIPFDELEAADPTSGMFRERAFELPILWAGRVTSRTRSTSRRSP